MAATANPKVGICGAAGRMGRMLVQTVLNDPIAQLGGGVDVPGSAIIGKDLAEMANMSLPSGVAVGDDAAELFKSCDVVIDFTLPTATDRHLELAEKTGTAWVLGTTGLSEDQQARVGFVSKIVPVLQAANFSLGVNLLLTLTERAAETLGPNWDIDILEMHHNQKIDAPSGTALALGDAAAAGREVALKDVQCLSREGNTGKRPVGEIGFATLRGGDVPGEHSVIFATQQERVELVHKAGDRAIFARGAVHAAKWLATQPPGRYGMNDVLGL